MSCKGIVEVIDRLLAPGGCPWDQKQTVLTMRPHLLEETYELLDAIHLDDKENVEEEFGDLLFMLLLLGRVAEKEKRFTLKEACEKSRQKFIRRHPHVFTDAEKILDADKALEQWNEIKKGEKKHQKGVLDNIPQAMPVLMRAEKVLHRLSKAGYNTPQMSETSEELTESSLGDALLSLVAQAQKQGLDAECALRKTLLELETTYSATALPAER